MKICANCHTLRVILKIKTDQKIFVVFCFTDILQAGTCSAHIM